MGVSYWSYLIVGCKVDKEKFKINKIERSCNCDIDKRFIKFCSKCGKEAVDESYDVIDGYKEDESFLELPLVHNTDHKDCWIAIYKEEIDDRKNSVKIESSKTIEELKIELKSKIEPFGLWDEDSFGVWCIQYCSY